MHRRQYLSAVSAMVVTASVGCTATGQSGASNDPDYSEPEPIPDEIDFGWRSRQPASPTTSLSIKVDYQRPQATIDLYPTADGYDQVYRPRPGEMFLIVVFELTHTEGAAIADAENLLLLETDDVTHEPVTFDEHENPTDEELEPVLTGTQIRPDAEFTGWLAYSVPRTFDMARITVNETLAAGSIAVEFVGRKISGIEDAYAPPPAE